MSVGTRHRLSEGVFGKAATAFEFNRIGPGFFVRVEDGVRLVGGGCELFSFLFFPFFGPKEFFFEARVGDDRWRLEAILAFVARGNVVELDIHALRQRPRLDHVHQLVQIDESRGKLVVAGRKGVFDGRGGLKTRKFTNQESQAVEKRSVCQNLEIGRQRIPPLSFVSRSHNNLGFLNSSEVPLDPLSFVRPSLVANRRRS